MLGQLTRLIEVITVDLDVDGVTTAGTRAVGRNRTLVLDDLRVARHLLTEDLGNLPDGLFALPFLGQTHGHLDLIVHRAGEQGCNRGIVIRTGRSVDQLDLRYQHHETGLECTGGLEGLFDTRTALQFDNDRETTVILLLHKVRTNRTGEDRNKRQTEDTEDSHDGDELMVQTPAERTLIVAVYDVQHTNDRLLVPAFFTGLVIDEVSVLVHMHFLGRKQLRTEHRSQ